MGELKDDRVVLRGWLESDLDFVFEARQDAEAQRFLAGMPTPFTLDDARRYLAFEQQREVGFVVADVVSRMPFDSIWMDRDRGVAEIGYWAAPASRGLGYVSRAVSLLADWAFAAGERTIEICTHPENHAAQAVARRCGFEPAGTVKEYTLWPDGSTEAVRYVRTGFASRDGGSPAATRFVRPIEPSPDDVHGAPLRPDWYDLPVHVRVGVEEILGGAIVASESRRGGFSPGVASIVTLSGGARWFVKAVGAFANPVSPELHRREARVAARLPVNLRAPRLRHVWDDGDWVALVFDVVDGRTPALPWRREELQVVLDALTRLSHQLTPPPLDAPRLADDTGFTGFRQLRQARDAGHELGDVDAWVVDELDRLSAIEEGWSEAVAGDTLLHLDLRADNILLDEDGEVWFVDWPHVTIGAAWVDLLGMLPSVAAQGGPDPWDVFGVHPLSREVDRDRAAAAVAGLAGFFLHHSRLPPHPGLPTVRRFQRVQADQAVRWLQWLLELHG